jgi:enediyne biosynthesis protein E4
VQLKLGVSMLVLLVLVGCDTAELDSGAIDRTVAGDDGDDAVLPVCGDADEYVWGFTDVAQQAGIQDPLLRNRGLAAADFDGDGLVDLYFGNPGDTSRLYRNMGDGTFRAQLDGVPTSGWDSSVAAADYDNDGDADLYISCGGFGTTCANKLFRNDGANDDGLFSFTDVSEDVEGMAETPMANFGGAWADYDVDGDLDLFVSTKDLSRSYADGNPSPGGGDISETGGPPTPDFDAPTTDRLYRNNGDGTFSDVSEAAGVADPRGHHRSVWLDGDLDGDPDLWVTGMVTDNLYYINNGDGTFTNAATSEMQSPFVNFASLAADFDNDGRIDLLAAANAGGETGDGQPPSWEAHGLFLNQHPDGFRSAAVETGLSDPSWADVPTPTMGLQVGDLNGDGWAEVVFGHGYPMPTGAVENQLFSAQQDDESGVAWMDLSGLILQPATVPSDVDVHEYPYRSHGMIVVDYDQDGDQDLIIGNGGLYDDQREPNRLFRNDTPCRFPYVDIDFELGAGVNRDGVGSVLRLSDGPPGEGTFEVYRTQHRSSGFNSSGPRVMRMYVGDHQGPFHLTVVAPGGEEHVFTDLEDRARVVVQ